MSVLLEERPADLGAGNGGLPARRALVRWAWRLFRREWRQQVLVLALLVAAVAGAAFAESIGPSAAGSLDGTFGTANFRAHVPADPAAAAADIAAAQARFGTVEVIATQHIPIPGSARTVDLRAQDPHGPFAHGMVRLLAGRYPTGPDEVAVNDRAARIFDLKVGDDWTAAGRTLHVVGRVENPADLSDTFALVAPGQAGPGAELLVLLRTTNSQFQAFRFPNGPMAVEGRPLSEKRNAAILMLVLSTVALLFVGLVAVAGFTVMAQRRLRALGMLRSLGATDRHIRLVMLANGAAVGASAAVLGTVIGLGGWLALAPRLETVIDRRIDRFDLPWWAIGAAMALAVLTSVGAAWWPARAAARVPVVTALSGRPPRPRPAHHFAALAVVLLVAGPALLVWSHQHKALFILGGIVATTFGILLLAPLAIRALATLARRAPIGMRLAIRDLARYQARSGAALGAITLAVGIAATIAVAATAAQAKTDETSGGNLPDNQLLVHLGPDAGGPLAPQTGAQLQSAQATVDTMAASLHAGSVLALDAAINPNAPGLPSVGDHPGGKIPASLDKPIQEGPGGRSGYSFALGLYVATPAVLEHYGIDPASIDPNADVLSSVSTAGLELASGPRATTVPRVQRVALPKYDSAPNSLLTLHAVQALGLQVVPSGWLVETAKPLTAAQVDAAEKTAAAAGLNVESRPSGESLTRLRNDATAGGVLVAIAVLAMTVGLIRSETANDLRVLTAAGATSTTRRVLTGATAGALALLGAVLGVAGAYAALVAWHHSHLHPLTTAPTADLVVLLAGLPLVAAASGWLLAGRQPPAVARQPLA